MNQLRLVLLGIALVLAGLFGWHRGDRPAAGWAVALWTPAELVAPRPVQPLSLEEARLKLRGQFAAIAEYQSYFDRLQAAFPAEYTRIVDGLATKAAGADSAPASVDRAFFQAARALRQTHGILAARAENTGLENIAAVQARLMQALAGRDARLCVDFFYGGAEPEFFAFMGQNRALAADFARAWLDAMANGKTSAISRPDPADADVQLFDDALVAHGLGRAEIDALLENKLASPPLQDSALCQAGIVYFQTLSTLPPEPRIKLMARILSLAARS